MLSWLWRSYLKPQRLWLGFALFFMAVEGSMLGALSYIIQPMFDEVFIAGDRSAVYWVAAAVGGIFVIRAVSAFSHRMLMQGAGLRIITTMQRDMVAHLMTLDSAYFQKNPPGTLIERVRGDTGAANMIWGVILSAAGRDLIGMIALLGVAISVDPLWTLVAVAGVPLLLGPVVALQRYVRKTTFRAREAAGRLSTRLDEIFHGVNTIKLNTSERRENNRFTEATDGYLKQEMKARAGQAGIPMMTDFVAAIGFAGVLVYGGNQIIDGDKTVGEFMSFFTAMGLLFEPVRRVANVTGAWQAARANLERIQEVFRSSPTISSPDTPARLATQPDEADIVFEDVVVVYGGEPALNGASFTAKAGQTTALVGASGAGKSTVFNVLTRLVDPSSGAVRIGGTPSGTLDLKDLRSLFSVVTQDAPMFDESLRDNIVLSTPGVDDARIEEAVAAANLSEFVARLPDGLDTPAGPRGSALSGGQKQRVAIARALLRRAPVLLLDEATSALDAESEVKVQEALDGLAQGRTTLVIAHRLSTVRKADKIIVMENGRVVDEGRHEELLERGGVYAKLHALQFDG
ncbi:ATP-binding cassette domain-containing protein [Alphaproteobacteria bacterium GH1-50]|uniref:ATP-binding cassette domain-containing protein n=1 Tax=Kangsaoukella pontilimi TaxID=2691042 RepID=A0A7C9MWV0_9RHOB|nr:ATP-binding cassette domain-containing protein [Kangsaoukella pontilimi]